MIELARKLFSKYSLLARVLFFVFIFCVLSFGRAFSVLHIEMLSFPIFVTEIVLLISLPLIIVNRSQWFKIPPSFLSIVFVYFLFGLFYLLWGFSGERLFVFRDFVVLCGYILFLPLAFVCFNNLKLIKTFLLIILVANFIAIIVGKILIFKLDSFWFYGFISKAKTYQIGIAYGISSAFLLSFYCYFKNKAFRFFILLLVSINLYMLLIFGVRSLWIAVICLVLFLMFFLGFRIMAKIYFKLLVMFIFISSSLFYIDFVVSKSSHLDVLLGRGKSFTHAFAGWSSKESLVLAENDIVLGKGSEITGNPAVLDKHDMILKGMPERTGKYYVPDEYGITLGGVPEGTGKPLVLDKHDKLLLRNKSENEGYTNIIWRKKIWNQTIEFVGGSYLFGKGLGRYPDYVIWGYKKPSTAFTDSNIIPTHNYLLTVFYKFGFLGLGLFLFINIYVFYYVIKYLKICN